MRLDDVPDSKGSRFPRKITLCVRSETQEKIKHLKYIGKDPHTLIRKAVEDLIASIKLEEPGV